MAEKKNSRDDDLRFRQNEPNLSHSSDPVRGVVEDDDSDVESSSGGLFKKLQNIRWVKKNPNLAKGIAVGALLLVLLLLFGWQLGWFGGGPKKARDVASQPQQPAPPLPGTTPSPEAEQQAKPVEKKPEGEAKKEENLPLSDDVTKWKKTDYFRARKENHAKLLEAVVFLGEKFHGSEPAAQGLTELLKPLPPEPPTTLGATSPMPGPMSPMPGPMPPMPGPMSPMPGQMPPMPGPMSPMPGQMPPTIPPRNQAELTKLVETIIAALGENGSDVARRTFEQILSGKLTTDDDKVAVEATLKALVAHPCVENDALLLRVLMTPEAMRPADRQGPWPAKELCAKTFELVKVAASPDLRAKLAELLADRLARFPPGDPIREFLLAADPRNGFAQAIVYEETSTAREIRIKLEQQLASYSAMVLGRLLAIPEGTETGTGGFMPMARPMPGPMPGLMAEPMLGLIPGPMAGPMAGPMPGSVASVAGKDDPNLWLQLAGLFWSEKFCTPVEWHLDEVKSLERQPSLVLLAATLPQDSTRVALAKLFRKRWTDGPRALEAAGLTNGMITDPGLLVVLKLSRKDGKPGGRTAAGAARGGKPATPRPTATPATGKFVDVTQANQKKEQTEQDWIAASSKLVASSLKRFHAAALEKADAESNKRAGDAAAPNLPSNLQLGEMAKPITSYHVLWPDDVAGKISGEKPSLLEVYYVRAEEFNKPKKAVSFYARQLQTRATEARMIDNNKAIWIDSVRLDSQSERRRSIDVWITRDDAEARDPAQDDMETSLIVEILVVEIKDPVIRETKEGRAAENKDE